MHELRALLKTLLIQYWYISVPAIIIVLAIVYFQFKPTINEIINDTLKREINGILRWSPTKMTMATAWWCIIYVFLTDFILHGVNETLFWAMLGVALGAKVTDAWSKKMNPLVQPPNNTQLNPDPQ